MYITFDGHRAKLHGSNPLIDIKLYQTLAYIPEGSQHSIMGQKFIFVGGRRVYNKRYVPNYDPTVHLYNRVSREFPAGLIQKVVSLYPSTEVKANHEIPEPETKQQLETLRDYQTEAAEALITTTHGMLEAATAAGKTLILSELCLRFPDIKVLVTVPSLDLLIQTQEELEKFTKESVGIYGDGHKDTDKRITVATIQSVTSELGIDKRTKRLSYTAAEAEKVHWLSTIRMWVVDECHGSAADSYQIASCAMPLALRRYGLTATLRREDNAEIVMEGVLGPCVLKITPARLIDAGWLTKPRVELHRLEHKNYRIAGGKTPFADVYRAAVTENTARTYYIVQQALRCIEEKKAPVLILFDRIDHGKAIYNLLKETEYSVELVNGSTAASKRKSTRDKVSEGEIDVVVASVVWVTGINIRNLRTVIVAGSGRSGIQTVQRAGRVLRTHEGKDEALIIDIYDDEHCYLQDQAAARRFHYNEKYPGYVHEIDAGSVATGTYQSSGTDISVSS
jgi:superfamily II DNA or RNA helicase